ncbi:cyclase family protein [Phaeodactylibacter xiamenensis]|uniref:cyclase family protein n=1 Tax=Phaeodactylibacter xiamenensis TaxID=1524460 RepID=UPI003BAA1AA7
MPEIIDLSQEIYSGMPVYRRLPPVLIEPYATHEEWAGETDPETQTPAVNRLDMGEHTGTHVDAISHMGKAYASQSIETMPLSTFYTSGFCLDFSHKGLQALIEPDEIAAACASCGQEIKKGDTLLFYTDHYRRAFGTPAWGKGPRA